MIGQQSFAILSDQELVASALEGERQAFGELVCRHQEGVVRVVYRMCGDQQLAEEAAQEAFLRAWQRLRSYKPQYAFRNWIFSIATHFALDRLRSERETVPVEDVNLPAEDGGGPEGKFEVKERANQVRRAVLALPPGSRAVLILREYEGLAYNEIASVLGIPVGTVMSRLNYARNQLRQALAGYLEQS